MELNIFKYSNYREFLKAFYTAEKEVNEKFSYRYFAQKAGFTSSNFLYLIITGKRNLSKDFIPKFSKALGLNKKEQQYFETLVSFNQAKTPEAKRYYMELLNLFSKDKTGKILKEEEYEYFSNWYYPVIREMVLLPHFEKNPKWIKKQLNNHVTIKQVNDALDTLMRLGLIKRDDTGRMVQADTHLITEDDVMHTAAYSFHQQVLSLAKHVLANTPGDKREISGITMALSKKQFQEIRRKVRDFEDHILKYLTDNPDVPNSVFQCNIQLFSVSEDKGE